MEDEDRFPAVIPDGFIRRRVSGVVESLFAEALDEILRLPITFQVGVVVGSDDLIEGEEVSYWFERVLVRGSYQQDFSPLGFLFTEVGFEFRIDWRRSGWSGEGLGEV
jgi:hypothetical protein